MKRSASASAKTASQAAGEEEAKLDLEHFLPYRLSLLSNRVSAGIARCYRDRFGLSVTEWRIIAVLGHHPGLSGSELAARTGMDKVAVHRALRGLAARRLVIDRRPAGDRRRQYLHLSAAGRRLRARIVPLAVAYQNDLLASVDSAGRRQLDHLLDRLLVRAGELLPRE